MKKISRSEIKRIKDLIRYHNYDSPHIFLEGFKLLDSVKTAESIVWALVSGHVLDNPEKKSIIDHLTRYTEVSVCSYKDFQYISSLKNPDGILISVKKPIFDKQSFFAGAGSVGVLLDNIQDPGNLGNIIRACCGFGIKAIFLYGEHCSPYNMKTIRASAGSVLSIPIFSNKDFYLQEFYEKGFCIYTSISERSSKNSGSLLDINFPPKMIIAFGNEGHGLCGELKDISHYSFYIPMNSDLESLNLANSVSITLFYLMQVSRVHR